MNSNRTSNLESDEFTVSIKRKLIASSEITIGGQAPQLVDGGIDRAYVTCRKCRNATWARPGDGIIHEIAGGFYIECTCGNEGSFSTN